MTGVRMSGLPVAKFCGRAAELSNGAGRAAAMSTAFHALCSNGLDKDAKLAKLTPEERDEIAEWQKPADVILPRGDVLRYEDAVTELEVAITATGGPCKADDPRAISVGHLDMAWVVTENDGEKTVYVGDIKKTAFTTLDGPTSLQLLAYAFAFGGMHDAEAYCCGIWQATEGRWDWGNIVSFGSEEAAAAWDDIYHAAQNTGGDFAMGPHCSGCWARFRCPAYLLPPELAESSLAPLTSEALRTNESMLKLLTLKSRVQDTLKVVDEELKAFSKHHGGIDDGNGKSWRPVETRGREGLDRKRLEAEMPEVAKKYTTRGAPYDQYRWVKAGGAK